jgi:hypothetical protein
MMQETHLDKLLHIIGDVGAQIITFGAQFARSEFFVPDIVEQQSLHCVDVNALASIEFILDHIEQTPMQTLHQGQRFQIGRT